MSDTATMLRSASSLHQAGRLHEAKDAYQAILATDRNNLAAMGLLGALYIQLGQLKEATITLEDALIADPRNVETLNNLGAALMAQGRKLEATTRFQQALKIKPDHLTAHTNLGTLMREQGVLADAIKHFAFVLNKQPGNAPVLTGMGHALRDAGQVEDALTHYRAALTAHPRYYDALTAMTTLLLNLGRADEAIAAYEKALKTDGGNPRLYNNLGNLLRDAERPQEAVLRFKKAIKLNPDYAEAYSNMGSALRDVGKLDEAKSALSKAIEIAPNLCEAHINLGTWYQDFGQMDDALRHYDQAVRIKPQSVDAQWNKAIALLAVGNYRDGWRLYESGLGDPAKRGRTKFDRLTLWEGTSLSTKRLLIWCEQGLGDSLQFIRYADLCKQKGAAEISVLCPPELERMMQSCPYVDRVLTTATEKDFDYHVPMLSLPRCFSTVVETIPAHIPYLRVDDAARAKWASIFPATGRPRIGLVWAGSARKNQKFGHIVDGRRSVGLQSLLPLFELGGVEFVSLQMGEAAKQLDGFAYPIANPMGDVADLMDTAAIIDQLDLVISVDTSVAHLAGALGKPVWILSRLDACWRWLGNKPETPWYPNARIFGQKTFGDWDAVIEDVRTALAVRYKT